MEAFTGSLVSNRYAGGKVLAAKEDGVGLVTFNQPEKRNAMSLAMWEGLTQILDEFREDHSIRVVILTGAGSKSFVSGADLSEFEMRRTEVDARHAYDDMTSAARAKLASFPKPVIARIRGYCLGGGLGIAMQADLRIAGIDSSFGVPAGRLGFTPGFDMVCRLVSLVGHAQARMLLYTGSRIDGQEAARIGLINRVVPDTDLSDAVLDVARAIADNAPLSLAAAKLSVDQAMLPTGQRDRQAVERAIACCFESADYREGRAAFGEKRAPRFQGR